MMKINRTIPITFSQKINNKNRFFPFSVLIFSLLVSLLQLTANQISRADGENPQINSDISSNITWLIFSSTEYSYERNLVRKHERIITFKSKKGEIIDVPIFIAVVDLNDDGVGEIFAYIDFYYYCGQQTGCPLNIYKIKNGKLMSLLEPQFRDGFPMFIEINGTGKQNMIGILPSKTMGWHDIALKGGTVWKCNGKDYGYRGN